MPSSKKGRKGRSKAKGGRSKAKSTGGRSDGAPSANNDGSSSRADVTCDDGRSAPPRSTADILGRIGPNAAPKESVIAELESALRGERTSDRHRSIVTRVAEAGGDESPPETYETPGMLELGLTPLLFGRDAPFRLADLDLPPCDVTVLSDIGMGESDWEGKWKGGSAPMMEFMGTFRGPVNVFIGECRLKGTDLWHLAVQFRRESGKFVWPGYWSVLMCPFCAELALPEPEQASRTFVMIVQGILQKIDGGMGSRYLPRICCKECFLGSLQPNGRDWGDYPALLGKSVPAHHFGHDDPRAVEPVPSAYTLSCLFTNCGMSGAIDRCTSDIMMQAVASSSSSARARISKSKTRANRGQTVMKFKDFIRKKCAGCGVESPGLSACSQCLRVYYCGAVCQRKHWRRHKRSCKGSSSEIAGDAEDEPRPSAEIRVAEEGERPSRESSLAENPCKKCHKHPDDQGCAAMCVSCGEFIVCENCSVTPELGGENASTTALFFFCDACRPKAKDAGNGAGKLLRRLLDERPTGRHVQYARLILAQCMFRDTCKYTGIEHDVEAARDEYMWLANDGDYAPAQLALASFHDPEARASEEIWDGPLNLLAICEVELPPGNLLLFPPSRKKAIQYYDRAVEQKMMIAIQSVATMYKNGTLYPVDKERAAMMLKEAANMGDGRAMCNLGQMLMRGDGIPVDMQAGLEYYRQAASMGIYSAMFMVAQVGMQNPALRGEGKQMMQRLRDNHWHPPFEHFQQQWMMACIFYSV